MPFSRCLNRSRGIVMGDRKQDRERDLVERCRSGSPDAWQELYRDYSTLVRSVVKDRLGKTTEQDIQDATQDVFVELMEALKRFDCSYGLSQFICGVAKRSARADRRRRFALKRNPGPDAFPDRDVERENIAPDPPPSPEEDVELEELKNLLRKGLTELSARCRDIIHYRDFQELSYGEIAKILGDTENTITVTRKRCMEQLSTICHALLREECTR